MASVQSEYKIQCLKDILFETYLSWQYFNLWSFSLCNVILFFLKEFKDFNSSFFFCREKKLKIEDIKKNIRDAILVSIGLVLLNFILVKMRELILVFVHFRRLRVL